MIIKSKQNIVCLFFIFTFFSNYFSAEDEEIYLQAISDQIQVIKDLKL